MINQETLAGTSLTVSTETNDFQAARFNSWLLEPGLAPLSQWSLLKSHIPQPEEASHTFLQLSGTES